jgi:predicted TPR repeat methyltransferase
MQPVFVTSGHLAADRRYALAQQYWRRGELEAAADILRQALELAPGFAAAWFDLGEIQELRGNREAAIAAFRKARDHDRDDRHGALLHLMRLGVEAMGEMPPAYVRSLFDQYAPEFNRALLDTLNYRGPRVIRDAVVKVLNEAGREVRFRRAIDLGCGTGLAARAFAKTAQEIIGCDLSPGMIAQARQTGLYDRLEVADMVDALAREAAASADLILSADAMIYLGDLQPLLTQVFRALSSDGLFVCTLETHEGEGVILGPGLRYAHSAAYVGEALAAAGLRQDYLAAVSTREESAVPVPGLVVVASRT